MGLLRAIRRPFRYSFFNATLALIVLNVGFFLLQQLDRSVYVYMGLCHPPAILYFSSKGAIPSFLLDTSPIWQSLTYMFMHSPRDIFHLAFNMFALFMFGGIVERRVGSKEFLLFYLLSGWLSGILSYLTYMASAAAVVLVGASGAIFSVMLAFATYYPEERISVWGIIPVRARVLVPAFIAIEVFLELTSSSGNVAHLTHVFGALAGGAYLAIRLRMNPLALIGGPRRRW
jgi:membrane associated rhomboid family serine protease